MSTPRLQLLCGVDVPIGENDGLAILRGERTFASGAVAYSWADIDLSSEMAELAPARWTYCVLTLWRKNVGGGTEFMDTDILRFGETSASFNATFRPGMVLTITFQFSPNQQIYREVGIWRTKLPGGRLQLEAGVSKTGGRLKLEMGVGRALPRVQFEAGTLGSEKARLYLECGADNPGGGFGRLQLEAGVGPGRGARLQLECGALIANKHRLRLEWGTKPDPCQFLEVSAGPGGHGLQLIDSRWTLNPTGASFIEGLPDSTLVRWYIEYEVGEIGSKDFHDTSSDHQGTTLGALRHHWYRIDKMIQSQLPPWYVVPWFRVFTLDLWIECPEHLEGDGWWEFNQHLREQNTRMRLAWGLKSLGPWVDDLVFFGGPVMGFGPAADFGGRLAPPEGFDSVVPIPELPMSVYVRVPGQSFMDVDYEYVMPTRAQTVEEYLNSLTEEEIQAEFEGWALKWAMESGFLNPFPDKSLDQYGPVVKIGPIELHDDPDGITPFIDRESDTPNIVQAMYITLLMGSLTMGSTTATSKGASSWPPISQGPVTWDKPMMLEAAEIAGREYTKLGKIEISESALKWTYRTAGIGGAATIAEAEWPTISRLLFGALLGTLGVGELGPAGVLTAAMQGARQYDEYKQDLEQKLVEQFEAEKAQMEARSRLNAERLKASEGVEYDTLVLVQATSDLLERTISWLEKKRRFEDAVARAYRSGGQ